MKSLHLLFPHRPEPPHPDTLIETWIVEILESIQGPVLNKTQFIIETWSQAKTRPPVPVDHQFGPSNPIIFVINKLPGAQRYHVYTKADFEHRFNDITTRTIEDRIKIRDSYGDMLANSIEEFKQIHARLQK